jgi:hypothetical protein
LAIFAAIRRASPLPLADLILTLLLVGFRWQTPNNYRQREHEGPRNQMISLKVRAKLGYMLYQKRQAAKRYKPAHCYFAPHCSRSPIG